MAKPMTRRPAVEDLDALLAGAQRIGRFLRLADGTWLPVIRGAEGDDDADETEGEGDRVDEILAALDAETPPTLDELQAYEAELSQLFDEARAQRTDAGLEAARRIADAYDRVVDARGEAEAEAERVDAELDELAGRFNRDGERNPDEGEGDDQGDEDEGEGDGEADDAEGAEREPVTASGRGRQRTRRSAAGQGAGLPPLPTSRHRQPGAPGRTALNARVSIVGERRPPQTNAEILASVWDVHANLGRARAGATQKVTVARANWEHPADQRLPRDNGAEAARIVDAHLSYQSLSQPGIVAAGGICGPLAVDYTIPVLGSDDRPFRDSLPSFGMDRGGLTWVPSPVLATDVPADSHGAWTVADDEDETPTPKVCAEIVCDDATTIEIEALYRCIEMTNFVNRYARERADAIMSLIRTDYARWTETRHLAVVDAGSTAVTWAPVLSAVRDYLAALGRVTAGYRRRHRVPRSVNLVAAFPDWLYDMLREDFANAMPSGDPVENMAIADAALDTLFRSRGVRPVPFMDGANAEQIFAGAQAAGALNDWPFRVTTYIYAEGTWVYGDGGQLDLGVVRDSTLNSTNRLQLFQEEFGVVYQRGNESIKLNTTICPNGTASALTEMADCATS